MSFDFDAYRRSYSPFASRLVMHGGMVAGGEGAGGPVFNIFCTSAEEDAEINAACDAAGIPQFSSAGSVARQTYDPDKAAVIARRGDVFISETVSRILATYGYAVEFHLSDWDAHDLGWSEGGRIQRLAVSTQKALVELHSASTEEIEAGYQACELMAYLDDDHAHESNDEGFGGAHVWIGHYTAHVSRGRFSRNRKSDAWAVRLGRHYREQLDSELKAVIKSNRKTTPKSKSRTTILREERAAEMRAEIAADRLANPPRSISHDLCEFIEARKERDAKKQAAA